MEIQISETVANIFYTYSLRTYLTLTCRKLFLLRCLEVFVFTYTLY